MLAFREAVEARDIEAMKACLADEVVFTSPVAFPRYPGKAVTGAILQTVMEVFSDFRYVREVGEAGGRDHVLVFEAMVGDKQVTGVDILHLDEAGLIDDFMVMVRPLSAATALAAEMGARWDTIVARATANAGG